MNARTLPVDVLDAAPAANDDAPWVNKSDARIDLPLVELAQPGDALPSGAADELVDRAEISDGRSLIKLSKSEAKVAELAAEHAAMPYDRVREDKDAEQRVRQFRMKCSAARTWLKENCLALRRPARDFAAEVISAEEIIRAQIAAIEKTGDELLTKLDEEKKQEKLRKEAEAAAERSRVDNAINAIRGSVNLMAGKPSAEIAEQIATVKAIATTTDEFGDRAGEAMEAKMDAVDMLQRMHDNAAHLERQQQEVARGQAALLKAQAEQRAIDDIGKAALRVMGKPAEEIAAMITEIEAIDVLDDVFGERGDEALVAQTAALETLRAMHDNALQAEARKAQQDAEAQRLSDQAAEQNRRQAEIDKADQERRDREAAELRERNERAERIDSRINAINTWHADLAEAGTLLLDAEIDELQRMDTTPELFGERAAEATTAIASALAKLQALRVAAEEREAEEARRSDEERAERERQEAAAALAAAVKEVSGEMFDVLCQWQTAEKRRDKTDMASAKTARDEIIARVKAPQA